MGEAAQLIKNVSGWLKLYSDGSVERNGPEHLSFVTEPQPPHENEFIRGVKVKDVSIDDDSALLVRIYLPEKTAVEGQKKRPIVLHFHGGGFCISQADWSMYYCFYSRLVDLTDAICVSVYLRNAPEHPLPAACEDGFSGLCWLLSLALGKTLEPWLTQHGDFTRIFLVGDSTGGNIVHQVAIRAGQMDLSPAKLAGAVMIHPGFFWSERSKSERKDLETPFLTLDMMDNFLELALPEGRKNENPIFCPMGPHALALEKLRLVPMLLCIAEKDMLWDTAIDYYEAMKKANQEIDKFVSHEATHCFYLNPRAGETDQAKTMALLQKLVDFITAH